MFEVDIQSLSKVRVWKQKKSNMAARRPFWKWRHWKSIGFCLWWPSTCIWNLKLKFQTKLDLCSGNHVVYRQTDRWTDGRTRWIQYTPPPTSLGRGIMKSAIILITLSPIVRYHCRFVASATECQFASCWTSPVVWPASFSKSRSVKAGVCSPNRLQTGLVYLSGQGLENQWTSIIRCWTLIHGLVCWGMRACGVGNCCWNGIPCWVGNPCQVGSPCLVFHLCRVGSFCWVGTPCRVGNLCRVGRSCRVVHTCWLYRRLDDCDGPPFRLLGNWTGRTWGLQIYLLPRHMWRSCMVCRISIMLSGMMLRGQGSVINRSSEWLLRELGFRRPRRDMLIPQGPSSQHCAWTLSWNSLMWTTGMPTYCSRAAWVSDVWLTVP